MTDQEIDESTDEELMRASVSDLLRYSRNFTTSHRNAFETCELILEIIPFRVWLRHV